MTANEAKDYLCQTVCDYLADRLPLVYLTGEGSKAGSPDSEHVEKLRLALIALKREDLASNL